MIRLLTLLFSIAALNCEAQDLVSTVSPGNPKETFLIGATTEDDGETISFNITISPRTTKPTRPFDCSVETEAGKIGWHIETPCYDDGEKEPMTEEIKISIPKSQLDMAVFEFRYQLSQTGSMEIW